MRLAEFRAEELERELKIEVSLSSYFARLVTDDIQQHDPKLYELLQDCLRTGLVSTELDKYLKQRNFDLQASTKYTRPTSSHPHKRTLKSSSSGDSYRSSGKKRRRRISKAEEN